MLSCLYDITEIWRHPESYYTRKFSLEISCWVLPNNPTMMTRKPITETQKTNPILKSLHASLISSSHFDFAPTQSNPAPSGADLLPQTRLSMAI